MKKKCICCGIEKDISEYYSHPRTADGHLNKCKECCKKQNKDNREKHLEYYREYDRNRKAKANYTSGGMNMFEKEAEDSFKCKKVLYKWETDKHSYIDGFKDGAEFGYNKANEWHNLQENPTDLPKCEENEQIIFYVKEWIESIQKYRTHYCLGFYKKAFLHDDVKVFVEKSRGYENEHLPISVLRWRKLEKWESE